MATKEMNLDAALDAIKKALSAKGGDFSQKAEASLEMLDASLGFFVGEGALARASVEVQMKTRKGGRYVRKYSLATKEKPGCFGVEVVYLKKSELEEDE
jgi:hypothetical protein